jgi:hypothetical protein
LARQRPRRGGQDSPCRKQRPAAPFEKRPIHDVSAALGRARVPVQ